MSSAEIQSKLDFNWQNELDKDKFTGLTWVQGKKLIHNVRFPPQSIQVAMLCLSQGGDDLQDWGTRLSNMSHEASL